MIYADVCTGIAAASVAWHLLGWRAAWHSEIEPFPCAVLAHHYPTVPNLGDMTRFEEWPDAAIDLLVGGTPCQSYSIAGLRKGLADPRGNLMLTYLAIARRYAPRWLVWENVPGVLSSNGGRDFGAFLGGLAELGYGFAYRVLDAQYVRVESHARAVPQRRRRVFVVGYLGDWRRAAAVLFERESLRGHPAPRREAWQTIAGAITRGAFSGGAGCRPEGAAVNHFVPVTPHVARALTTSNQRIDAETETLLVANSLRAQQKLAHRADMDPYVTHALRGEGFDASEDGTGRGTPLVPIAFDCKASGRNGFSVGDVAPTLRSMGHTGSHHNGGGHAAVAHSVCMGSHPIHAAEVAMPQTTRNGDPGVVQYGAAVRRLTPRECERLQGFPDDYTLIQLPKRNRHGTVTRMPLAKDGPRYKALGNSMAIPPMHWIGSRIQVVDDLFGETGVDTRALQAVG
ncbi:DNA cytosine methyltransferase [Paraburkholderia sp. MM5477-R1]|uniref:DNA cytosine methyltransferase n=1 Tax=Paraburkholderia sp. MM5477-R1 TaxID=2991062 RepID=UPI003D19FC2B